MQTYIRWQQTPRPVWVRILVLFAAFLVFPVGLPFLFLNSLPAISSSWGWSSISLGWGQGLVGWALVLFCGALAIWTIITQMIMANGTPLPMIPTQKLVWKGPYRLCRNPMVLGTCGAYLGMAIISGSMASILAAVAFAVPIIAYVPLVEEKELEARFGAEYLEYKKSTPFMLPRLPK